MRPPPILCWIALAAALPLPARLTWEMTALSWKQGPQLFGFAIAHSAVGGILLLALLLALAWAAMVGIAAVFSARPRRANLIVAAAIAVLAAATFIPYGTWVRPSASRIAQGPHAVEFLVFMAAAGETGAVAALLDRGVPINASNRGGLRAMDAAIEADRPAMRDYLASRGGTDKRF